MKIRMLNAFIEAEGSEPELAYYTMLILECLKHSKEREDKANAEKEIRAMEELMKIPIEELLKREQDGGSE